MIYTYPCRQEVGIIVVCFIAGTMRSNQTVVLEYDFSPLINSKKSERLVNENLWDYVGDLLIDNELNINLQKQDTIFFIIPTNRIEGSYYSESGVKALLNCRLKTKYYFLELWEKELTV